MCEWSGSSWHSLSTNATPGFGVCHAASFDLDTFDSPHHGCNHVSWPPVCLDSRFCVSSGGSRNRTKTVFNQEYKPAKSRLVTVTLNQRRPSCLAMTPYSAVQQQTSAESPRVVAAKSVTLLVRKKLEALLPLRMIDLLTPLSENNDGSE
jgi:hypothetical protein